MTIATPTILTPSGPLPSLAEFPLSSGRLVVALEGRPPRWAEPTLRKLGELLRLQAGWNSYGARPVDPSAAWAAFQLLSRLLPDDASPPAIVPTSGGGVQLEWHTRGVDLEITVRGPGKYHALTADSSTDQSEEQELTDDLAPLLPWIARVI